jgi:hypothetical protein
MLLSSLETNNITAPLKHTMLSGIVNLEGTSIVTGKKPATTRERQVELCFLVKEEGEIIIQSLLDPLLLSLSLDPSLSLELTGKPTSLKNIPDG